MNIREQSEEIESRILQVQAAKSRAAIRRMPEEACELRTAFQRDRDRILHSKSFRRLKHKTQVYISPGDHYRTRMTHSLEVAQISRTIARALRLNEDLTEAIALGHDVGHTPFGHAGEQALRGILGHFEHNEQSLRVVQILERDGTGLNLTDMVEDGILRHTGSERPATLEGRIVHIGDRIAYLCHDLDDGIRAGMLTAVDVPKPVRERLGDTPSQMITTMVQDIVDHSFRQNDIGMSKEVQEVMDAFRQFMFERVYFSAALEPERRKAQFVIQRLFSTFLEKPDRLPLEFQQRRERWGLEASVMDYIAGLTDLYAIQLFQNLSIPKAWSFEFH